MRAFFDAGLEDGVIVIYDLGGFRSITNDAEAVIEDVARLYDLSQHRVIYQDTAGEWDGIAVVHNKFAGFILLPQGTRKDEAMAMAQSWPDEKWVSRRAEPLNRLIAASDLGPKGSVDISALIDHDPDAAVDLLLSE